MVVALLLLDVGDTEIQHSFSAQLLSIGFTTSSQL